MNVGRVAHLFEWSWTADDAASWITPDDAASWITPDC